MIHGVSVAPPLPGRVSRCHTAIGAFQVEAAGLVQVQRWPSTSSRTSCTLVLAELLTSQRVRTSYCSTVFVLSLFSFASIARALSALVAEYGPVITLQQGSQVTIIVGRMEVGFLLESV